MYIFRCHILVRDAPSCQHVDHSYIVTSGNQLKVVIQSHTPDKTTSPLNKCCMGGVKAISKSIVHFSVSVWVVLY